MEIYKIFDKKFSKYPTKYQMILREFFSFFIKIQNFKDFLILEKKNQNQKKKKFIFLYRELSNVSIFFEKLIKFFTYFIKKFCGFTLFSTEIISTINEIQIKSYSLFFFYQQLYKKKQNFSKVLKKYFFDSKKIDFKIMGRYFIKYLSIFTVFKIQFWVFGISTKGNDQNFFILFSTKKKKNKVKPIIKKKKIPFFIKIKNAKKILMIGLWLSNKRKNYLENIFFFSCKKVLVSLENFVDFFAFYKVKNCFDTIEKIPFSFEFIKCLDFGLFKKKKLKKFGKKYYKQQKFNFYRPRNIKKKKYFQFLKKKIFFEQLDLFPFVKIEKIFLAFYKKCSKMFWEIEKLQKNFSKRNKIFRVKNNSYKNNFFRFTFWIQKKFLFCFFIIKKYFSCKFFQKDHFPPEYKNRKKIKVLEESDNLKRHLEFLKKKFFFCSKNKNLCAIFLKLFPSIKILDFLMKERKNDQKILKKKKTKNKLFIFFYDHRTRNLKKKFLKIILISKKFEKKFLDFSCAIYDSHVIDVFFFFFHNIFFKIF